MIRRTLDSLAVIAFVAFLPLLAVAQSGVSPISASPGAKPGQGTKTTCTVAGGVWRTSDPAATLDCGAGLTYTSAAGLTVTGSASGGVSVPARVIGGTGTSAGGFYLGAYNATFGGFWSGGVTPSASNYALIASSTRTALNAPSGADIRFYINDSTSHFVMDVNGVTLGPTVVGGASLGSTVVPLAARLGTGSTANVFEMQNSAGTNLSFFDSTGRLVLPNGGIRFGSTVGSTGLLYGSGVQIFVTEANYPFFAHATGISTGAGQAFSWTSGTDDATATKDTFLIREAAATVQLGLDVNGAAVNQTLKSHDGITGTDISGANMTIAAGRGTGTGAGGTIAFQTAPVEASGTTTQTLATRMTIQKDGGITLAGVVFANLGTPADGTLFFCSDCTIASPCAGAGTGAFAKRLNGAWVCN